MKIYCVMILSRNKKIFYTNMNVVNTANFYKYNIILKTEIEKTQSSGMKDK